MIIIKLRGIGGEIFSTVGPFLESLEGGVKSNKNADRKTLNSY